MCGRKCPLSMIRPSTTTPAVMPPPILPALLSLLLLEGAGAGEAGVVMPPFCVVTRVTELMLKPAERDHVKR